MDPQRLTRIIEGALLAAAQPLSLAQLNALFEEDERPGHGALREALAALDADLEERAVELVEVAGGYRLQIRQSLMPTISKLWSEKPPRYSRALLETLAIIAYRQPITRGEIEQIRGVSLSANILKTLQEREWVKVVGHRDIPGKPELLGTTREFLDYFNLKGLDDLPTLAEIRDLDNLEPELDLTDPDRPQEGTRRDEDQGEEPDLETSEDQASTAPTDGEDDDERLRTQARQDREEEPVQEEDASAGDSGDEHETGREEEAADDEVIGEEAGPEEDDEEDTGRRD